MNYNDVNEMNRTNENDNKLAYIKPVITTFSEKELSDSIQAYGTPLPTPPSTS